MWALLLPTPLPHHLVPQSLKIDMVIGITGGMGSGKSSLARLFEKRGAVLIDADRIGHEVIERPRIRKALKKAFGESVVDAQGKLNRRELGRRAFVDAKGGDCLNRIVHPPLVKELWRQVERAEGPGLENVVVVDAALIFEWGELHRFDAVVVVHAKEEAQIERVARRHHLSRAEIRQRLVAQMPTAEKKARADFVVENNGSLQELDGKADKLWRQLVGARAAASEDAARH